MLEMLKGFIIAILCITMLGLLIIVLPIIAYLFIVVCIMSLFILGGFLDTALNLTVRILGFVLRKDTKGVEHRISVCINRYTDFTYFL